MKLIITTEQHFFQLPDDKIFSTGSINQEYFYQFLGHFESIIVIARVKKVETLPKNYSQVNSKKIFFIALPDWLGPIGFVRNYLTTTKIIKSKLPKSAAYLLTMPSIISIVLFKCLNKQPYGVHVIGDPNKSFSGRLSAYSYFSKFFFTYWQKKICSLSAVAIYVAGNLKKIYPSKNITGSIVVSDIIIKKTDIAKNHKAFGKGQKRLIFIGTLSQLYKGQITLVQALRICNNLGLNFRLKIVGSGIFQKKIEIKSRKLNLQKQINFLGQLNGLKEIKNALEKSEVFILPSINEGMPRALIEAMAQGLVCIGSDVGGIPELLGKDFLVDPRNKVALAKKIIEICRLDPSELSGISKLNISVAKRFIFSKLKKTRDPFLNMLRVRTEKYYKN